MSLVERFCSMLIVATILAFFPQVSHAQSMTKSYVPGEVIVKYKVDKDQLDGKGLSSKAKVSVLQKQSQIAAQKGLSLKSSWPDMATFNYKINSNKKVSEIIAELKSDPNVEYVEPNYYVSMAQSVKETGALSGPELQDYIDQNYFPNQVATNSMTYDQTGAPIQIPETWQILSANGTPPVVAIIDTGIELEHPSLRDAIWTNPGEIPNNGIDDDGNGYIDDVNGWNFSNNNNNPEDCNDHGTHVAGIVRGSTQDIIPDAQNNLPSGINQSKVKLMAVKFLDCDGIGTTSDAVNAIYYAVNNGAKILNNSWGGGGYSSSLHEAIYYAYQHDVLFVAAAGNSGIDIDSTPMYPASYPVPNVIAVAATNSLDYLPYFSNYGASTVAIAAPGVAILSTVINDSYASMSGTSMATPFISGIAAMMAYEQPDMNGYQLKNILTASIDKPFIDTNGNGKMDAGETYKLDGKVQNDGRVNSKATVQMAENSSVDPSQPSYNISAFSSRDPASNAAGGGCGLVQKVYDDYDHQQKDSQKNTEPLSVLVTLMIFLVPLVTVFVLRRNPRNQRRYDRFFLGSQVQITVGQKEYLGSVGTISLGGLSLNSEAIFKLGHALQLSVASPDGNDRFLVDAQVVWTSNNSSYGVKFVNTAEETIFKIHQWTQSLKKM